MPDWVFFINPTATNRRKMLCGELIPNLIISFIVMKPLLSIKLITFICFVERVILFRRHKLNLTQGVFCVSHLTPIDTVYDSLAFL